MQANSRRLALKQMLLFTVGSSCLYESCKTTTLTNGVRTKQPLGAVHVPFGTISKPADGVVAGAPKIRAEHTNGQFCCQEITVQPKHAGPPPHVHKDLDEIMFVIEGAAHVMVGDTVTEVRAGDYHLRPHGVVHTFWNSGDVPVRFIDMYPNQDFVSFFEELTRIEKRLKSKGLDLLSPEGQKLNTALLKKYGSEIFFDQFPPLLQKYGLKT